MIQGNSESVKTENSISQKIYFKRKQLCPNHDLKYRYECMSPKCEHRYLCGKQQCIQNHFHNETLSLKKFYVDQYHSKFEFIQNAINNEQKVNLQLNTIRSTIQGLRGSITEIFKDLELFQSNCQDLKSENEATILYNYVDKYDELINLQSKIKSNIEHLRSKLNGAIQEKDFHYFKMKNILQHALKSKINGFSWDNCIQVMNTHRNFRGCDKFHQKLQGKSNLLFLFIGQKCLIGSFYPDPYPTLQQKTMKSPNSFIFYHEGKEDNEFVFFKANPESEHHLHISEKLIICHGNTPSYGDGVRTFARNLESIDFYLPSSSYLPASKIEEEQLKIYSGKLVLRTVKVLQVRIEK